MNASITQREQELLRQLGDGRPRRRADFRAMDQLSHDTMIRDLNRLVARGLVAVNGAGRATSYSLTAQARREVVFDPAAYLRRPMESRIALRAYDPELLGIFDGCLPLASARRVEAARGAYRERRLHEPLHEHMAQRALEAFTIELSWISSMYEGNTYTVFDTERLIKDGQPAAGHPAYEATMILNHKRAIDYIWQHQQEYRHLTRQQVLEIHQLLSQDLFIPQGLRQVSVTITGTAYAPPGPGPQLAAYMDDTITAINRVSQPAEKALACLALLAYLQPFADGNKRTSRLMANAVLLAHDYPPISFVTATEEAYKSAMLLFYEQGTVGNLSQLFVEQMEYAGDHYFLRPEVIQRQRIDQPQSPERRASRRGDDGEEHEL